MVQTQTEPGHDGSEVAGRIESIEMIPAPEFSGSLPDSVSLTDGAVIVYGRGTFDLSPAASEAQRLMENGAGEASLRPRALALSAKDCARG